MLVIDTKKKKVYICPDIYFVCYILIVSVSIIMYNLFMQFDQFGIWINNFSTWACITCKVNKTKMCTEFLLNLTI